LSCGGWALERGRSGKKFAPLELREEFPLWRVTQKLYNLSTIWKRHLVLQFEILEKGNKKISD